MTPIRPSTHGVPAPAAGADPLSIAIPHRDPAPRIGRRGADLVRRLDDARRLLAAAVRAGPRAQSRPD
jgi:hypothetical protein